MNKLLNKIFNWLIGKEEQGLDERQQQLINAFYARLGKLASRLTFFAIFIGYCFLYIEKHTIIRLATPRSSGGTHHGLWRIFLICITPKILKRSCSILMILPKAKCNRKCAIFSKGRLLRLWQRVFVWCFFYTSTIQWLLYGL